jgi:hypothetical protein
VSWKEHPAFLKEATAAEYLRQDNERLGYAENSLKMLTSGYSAQKYFLGGHVKTGHAWSLQNRPCEMAQDVILFYPSLLLIEQACFGPPAPRPAFEDMAVVEKAIQHGGDGRAVAEQFAPVLHRPVGG